MVLRCKAMELESLRCIVSRLEKVVVVNQLTYYFFGDTLPQGTFKHICDVCLIKKFSGGGGVIGNKMRLELTRVCSLNGFYLWFFNEC